MLLDFFSIKANKKYNRTKSYREGMKPILSPDCQFILSILLLNADYQGIQMQ